MWVQTINIHSNIGLVCWCRLTLWDLLKKKICGCWVWGSEGQLKAVNLDIKCSPKVSMNNALVSRTNVSSRSILLKPICLDCSEHLSSKRLIIVRYRSSFTVTASFYSFTTKYVCICEPEFWLILVWTLICLNSFEIELFLWLKCR